MANIPKEKIVYADETGIDKYLYRQYGRAKKGEKVIAKVSGRKFKRVGIVAAQIRKKIIEPLQYNGTMNSSLFEAWFEKRLLPALPEECTITLDNASFHSKKRLLLLAEKYGHNLVFLPPYSPELNDIEPFWACLKKRLRKVLPDYSSFDDAISDCFQVC